MQQEGQRLTSEMKRIFWQQQNDDADEWEKGEEEEEKEKKKVEIESEERNRRKLARKRFQLTGGNHVEFDCRQKIGTARH